MRLYEKSCNGDYGQGCITMGTFYGFISRTNQDKQKAIESYTKAIALGKKEGYFMLGSLLEDDVEPKSISKAFEYYQQGCDKGEMDSCLTLAKKYEDDENVG